MLPLLVDHRVACVNPDVSPHDLASALDAFPSLRIAAWRGKASPGLARYAKSRAIDIENIAYGPLCATISPSGIRGDIQSLTLEGSQHLLEVLESHDFAGDPATLEVARSLRHVMRTLRVSRRTLAGPFPVDATIGPRLRRRILVIGGKSDTTSVIELAMEENASSEIVYLPYFEVFRGSRDELDTLASRYPRMVVLRQDLPLDDLLDLVDHVYVRSAFGGFEALMRDVPVTVTGAPFYAGWGLTDDRHPGLARKRSLTPDELFCGVFLLRGRYLLHPTDRQMGCLSAMLALGARREILTQQAAVEVGQKPSTAVLAASTLWMCALWPSRADQWKVAEPDTILESLPLEHIFGSCLEASFHRSLVRAVAAAFRGTAAFERALIRIRGCVRLEIFEQLVLDLAELESSPIVLGQLAWCRERAEDFAYAHDVLEHLALDTPFQLPTHAWASPRDGRDDRYLALAEYELRTQDYTSARGHLEKLLLKCGADSRILAGLAEAARGEVDFASAKALLALAIRMPPQRAAHVALARYAALAKDPARALEAMATVALTAPHAIERLRPSYYAMADAVGKLSMLGALHLLSNANARTAPIDRALQLISVHDPESAQATLLNHKPKARRQARFDVALSLAYSHQGKTAEGWTLLEDAIRLRPTASVLVEALRVAIQTNELEKAQWILEKAEAMGVVISDSIRRQLNMGLARIGDAFETFREMKLSRTTLPRHLGPRFARSLNSIRGFHGQRVLVCAIYGPGDEIRFASLYAALRAHFAQAELAITCDPRLRPLLARSLGESIFSPVHRLRSIDEAVDLSTYSQLPESDLSKVFDNKGWALAQQSDHVLLITDVLADLLRDGESFKGSAYLRADPKRMRHWAHRLRSTADGPWVGLSWRSRLNSAARTHHYLSVEDLHPIFEGTDLRFVNLQYDDCEQELEELSRRYPGRIHHFPDLDQYNDFEGVSALMCNLDLIVSPATTVIELAGALGRPALMLSNSSELHWRRRASSLTDRWHHSVHHVEGSVLGDKRTLVAALVERLSQVTHRGSLQPQVESSC